MINYNIIHLIIDKISYLQWHQKIHIINSELRGKIWKCNLCHTRYLKSPIFCRYCNCRTFQRKTLNDDVSWYNIFRRYFPI